jgi:hypothetical protein
VRRHDRSGTISGQACRPALIPLLEDDLAEPGLITHSGFTPHWDV